METSSRDLHLGNGVARMSTHIMQNIGFGSIGEKVIWKLVVILFEYTNLGGHPVNSVAKM